ncbi:hypothetical protein ACIRRA_11390 [Nocardia sp. NPDC101769]|uniref:hypothetical protein n=1 Tax=Nocardia sp. NPDC101769 TaxID=3364333 RepID=UPI0037FF4CA9
MSPDALVSKIAGTKAVTVVTEDRTKTRQRVPSENYGCRKRWRARYVDNSSQEHVQSFVRKADAQSWLDGVTSSLVTGTHIAPSAGRETIGEIGRRWLAAQAHLKEATAFNRGHTWGLHVKPR